MRLMKIYLMIVLLSGLVNTTDASCLQSKASGTQLSWRQLTTNDFRIDAILPSGIKVKGIRYRWDKLSKKWVLQLKSTSKTKIWIGKKQLTGLTENDFNLLINSLILSVQEHNDGRLDSIHLGLSFINELWINIVSFLRNEKIPQDYILKAKDPKFSKKIITYLKESLVMNNLCNDINRINKACSSNFISMNPITFTSDNIGKKWLDVKGAPNLEIPTAILWFGLNFNNLEEN